MNDNIGQAALATEKEMIDAANDLLNHGQIEKKLTPTQVAMSSAIACGVAGAYDGVPVAMLVRLMNEYYIRAKRRLAVLDLTPEQQVPEQTH
jgi:hypothetical protein